MMPRTTSIAATAVLALVLGTACTGSSNGVDVPGASTTVAATTAPADTASTSTAATADTELPTPTPAPQATDPPTAEPGTPSPATDPPPATDTTSGTSPETSPDTSPDTSPEITSGQNPDFLRQGDEGPRIGLIQFKLVVLDYLPAGGDTGVFDSATNSAILAFQGDYGLIVDGIIGPETERAISAAAESINPEQ